MNSIDTLHKGGFDAPAGWGPIECMENTVFGECEVLKGDPPVPGIVYPKGMALYLVFTKIILVSGCVERIDSIENRLAQIAQSRFK